MSRVLNYCSFLTLLALSACSASKITLWTADPVAWPGQCVVVYGTVIGDNGNKIPGVTVATHGAAYQTDAYGAFTYTLTASTTPNGVVVVKFWFPETPEEQTAVTIRTASGSYNVTQTGNALVSYAAESTYITVIDNGWFGHVGVADVYGTEDERWHIDKTRAINKEITQGTYLRINASDDATVLGGAYTASGSQNVHGTVNPVAVYTWVGNRYPSRVMRVTDIEWGIEANASAIYQTGQKAHGVATVTFIPPPDVLGKLGNSLIIVTAIADTAGNQANQSNDTHRDAEIIAGSAVISAPSRSVVTTDSTVVSSDNIVEGVHTPCQAITQVDAHVNTTVSVVCPPCP